MDLYSAKYTFYFLQLTCYKFENKMAAQSLFLDYPCITIFNYYLFIYLLTKMEACQ